MKGLNLPMNPSKKQAVRVAVAGATGYAGAELVRILSGHPHAVPTLLTSRQFAGERFDRVYPGLAGHVDLVCEDYCVDRMIEAADIVFLALPHKIPMESVPALIAQGKKVIDLSADFRFKDAAVYEAHYQPHTAKDLLSQAAYGLCEVYPEEIRRATLIGNPGCYPTSILLPLVPLVRTDWIDAHSIIADSKSGVSGAGRSLSLATHFCEVSESYKAYKVGVHRHNPEIEAVLQRERGDDVQVTFVPHLVPMSRGMLTTIYLRPKADLKAETVREHLAAFYSQCPFVRICAPGQVPDTRHVRGTNYCDIGVCVDAPRRCLILICAIDNLVKGAAGQAVQNMNLMQGWPETAGLDAVPFPL